MTDAALWGHSDDDETLDVDLDDAIGRFMDNMLGDDDPLQSFFGWSALPPGESGGGASVPSAARMTEWIAETIADDCGFEDMGADFYRIAALPEVIEAFDVARSLFLSKQTFLVADRRVQTATVRFMWEGYDNLTYEIWKIEDES